MIHGPCCELNCKVKSAPPVTCFSPSFGAFPQSPVVRSSREAFPCPVQEIATYTCASKNSCLILQEYGLQEKCRLFQDQPSPRDKGLDRSVVPDPHRNVKSFNSKYCYCCSVGQV